MSMLRVLDLFSGIGGFSLGLERTGGFETVAFCEIDPFCRRVLAKHWPNVRQFNDVTKLRGEDVGAVDVICGGFPCQDISWAGQGRGLHGERSGLWREFARLIGELRPKFALVENSAALLARGMGDLLADISLIGYDAEWHAISAADLGAPHSRERLWVVAYPQGGRQRQLRWLGSAAESKAARDICWPRSEPPSQRVAFGVPDRVERVTALGNALLPQIPELIGRAILEARATSSPT